MTYILYEKETGKIISTSETVPQVTEDQVQIGNVTLGGIDWNKISLATTAEKVDAGTDISKIIKQDIAYKTLIPVSLESRIKTLEERVAILEKP